MDAIWNYYRDAASCTGRNQKTGKMLAFSLEFFFCGFQPRQQNPLVRAFLGDDSACPEGGPAVSEEEIAPYLSQVTPPYPEQRRAILRALASPISLVQGPPGTGKTEMILNLISVIRNLYPDKTIAVVSTNHEALKNIYDKIVEGESRDPMLASLLPSFAVLGSKRNVKEWRDQREPFEDVSEIPSTGRPVDPAYLRRYPVFSSTVHSLRKIFAQKDGFENQFDFVIADECSQMSVMLGIVAMSCARQLVIIGDDQQLTPIIPDKLEELAKKFPDVPPIYLEQEGKSFLSACAGIFPHMPATLLNMHYRCHPSIIRFCNQHIYENQLQLAAPDDGDFRMRAVWYEGDYCEKWKLAPSPQEDGGDKIRYQTQNRRQIEIFLREELPRLAERLKDPEFSLAVICPFRGPIELLGRLLPQRLEELELSGQAVSDNLNDIVENIFTVREIPQLTIHKAQGKGFSAVVLLTAEDYYKGETPWCQQKRLMNVAVSRAKEVFTVITSSQWLPEEIQRQLTGYVLPNGQENEPAEGMYYRKLLAYIAEHCPEPRGEFGLHRSGIASVFDRVPWFRRAMGTKRGSEDASAPALCMAQALWEQFGEEYAILSELPLKEIEQISSIEGASGEMLAYLDHSRMDFALCQGNQVALMIEVDGAYHREAGSQAEKNDQLKNSWIALLQGEDRFLRLPTDGSTAQEAEEIRRRLERGHSTLTATQEGLRQAQAVSAQFRARLLMDGLAGRTEGHLAKLEAFLARNDMRDSQKLDVIRMDFTHAEAMKYNTKIRNSFYLCRYATAYAFEYALLYDLALRLHRQSGSSTLGVFSFGAGSLVDAWSLAYARERLAQEDAAYGEMKLYYKGVDEQLWGDYYAVPQRIYDGRHFFVPQGGGDCPCAGSFEKLWLYRSGIAEFLESDILSRTGCKLYYDTLVFPKIINELTEEDVAEIEQKLERVRLTHPAYYLLVSHSRYQLEKSAETLERLLRALDPDGRYERCCDVDQLLSPENRQAFQSAWAAGDPLLPLLEGELDSPRGYAFQSSIQTEDGEERSRALPIRSLNPDFAYDGPRQPLYGLDAMQKRCGMDPFPCQQMLKVSTLTFDVIRLKKKEDDPHGQ